MPRCTIGLLATLALLVAPLAAEPLPAGPLPRLAVLSPGDAAALTGRGLQAFFNGLRDLGYVDGQTILVEYRRADWQLDRLPALAAELVRLKPDVLVTYTTPGALAAKAATTTIPIVVYAGDLVRHGLVESLAHPGGNLTGLQSFGPELYGKHLALLKEAVPQITRVAVLVNPDNPISTGMLGDVEAEARARAAAAARGRARSRRVRRRLRRHGGQSCRGPLDRR